MKEKERLTDRKIKSLKPQAKPYDTMDTDVRAFGVRTLPTGEKSFILYRRYPGSNTPVRRTLGHYSEISLADARELARDWIAQIKKGIDPARAAEQARKANIEAERARNKNTVKAALTSYLLAKSELRSVRKMEVEMQRELASWMDRPILDIRAQDVKDLINAIKLRGRKGQARATYALVKGFFTWVTKTDDYGLDASPCARIDTKTLVGENREVTRVLADHELRAYWHATATLGYPLGPYFRLLLLTAVRRTEASNAAWKPEIDLDAKRWIIPAERMKGKPGKARAHLVPITPAIEALLNELPRHAGGPFLFSTTGGRTPISAFSKAKNALDAAMKSDLETHGHAFEDFTIHDIRRTCRTRFSDSKLVKIDPEIRERLLAHTAPKIQQIYDLHEFEDEKRAALESWHRALENITDPRPPLRVVA